VQPNSAALQKLPIDLSHRLEYDKQPIHNCCLLCSRKLFSEPHMVQKNVQKPTRIEIAQQKQSLFSRLKANEWLSYLLQTIWIDEKLKLLFR